VLCIYASHAKNCNVLFHDPRYAKGGVKKFSTSFAREIVPPHFQNRDRVLMSLLCFWSFQHSGKLTPSLSHSHPFVWGHFNIALNRPLTNGRLNIALNRPFQSVIVPLCARVKYTLHSITHRDRKLILCCPMLCNMYSNVRYKLYLTLLYIALDSRILVIITC